MKTIGNFKKINVRYLVISRFFNIFAKKLNMSKIIGKYEFSDVTKDFDSDYEYRILHLTPTITCRHKYWYFWEFEFVFWKWNKRIEICRTDWKDHPERDKKLFFKRLMKLYKKENGKN